MSEYEKAKQRTHAVIDVTWKMFVKYLMPWIFTLAVVALAVVLCLEMIEAMGSLADDPMIGETKIAADIVGMLMILVFLAWFAGIWVGSLFEKIDADKKKREDNDTETTQDN